MTPEQKIKAKQRAMELKIQQSHIDYNKSHPKVMSLKDHLIKRAKDNFKLLKRR